MQKLIVDGFLGIKKAEINLDGLTVLIGPQASGKSVVARLFFFCTEYFADLDELALMKNEHKTTYDSRKREDFCKLFPSYSWSESEFLIEYRNEMHSLTLKSKKGSSSVEISTSASVAKSFRNLKKSYQDFAKSCRKIFMHLQQG
jgi:predicted ATPase